MYSDSKKNQFIYFDPKFLFNKLFSSKNPYRPVYQASHNPLFPTAVMWNDFISNIPGKENLFSFKSWRENSLIQVFSHNSTKKYLDLISNNPIKDNSQQPYQLEAIFRGHAHLPGGIVKLKNKIETCNSEGLNHYLCHCYHVPARFFRGIRIAMEYFLTVVGMVLIVEGLPYFTFPEKMKSLMERIPQMPTHWLRVFGLIAITTGLLILYLSKYIFF